MSRVALIGASGHVGSRILKELVSRNHSVTAIARDPKAIEKRENVTVKKGDVLNGQELAALLRGHDAVISAVRFTDSDPAVLVDAVRASAVKRYLVVGGAGSLEIAPGQRLMDQPAFPEAYKTEAFAGGEFLNLLRGTDDLDWTFLSPSALFVAGERTGKFRLGDDTLIVDEAGKSSVSFEDFAVALVDELEKPTHIRRRFTVGY